MQPTRNAVYYAAYLLACGTHNESGTHVGAICVYIHTYIFMMLAEMADIHTHMHGQLHIYGREKMRREGNGAAIAADDVRWALTVITIVGAYMHERLSLIWQYKRNSSIDIAWI